MNTTINILGERLQALIGDVHFRSDFDKALDSPGLLFEIGKYNIRESEKLEAIEEESKERILYLMSTILASGFQENVIDKYGNDDTIAVRKFLEDLFRQPDNQAFWGRIRQTAEQELLGSGLTEDQCQAVMRYTVDRLPDAIMGYLEELYSPSRFAPRSEAQFITTALVDMMEEVSNADSQRHN